MEGIDEIIDISKAIHIVDADSSQAVVIEEACAGRNLVVQGPPGTGKSQTITNIIAAAVHSGKTVLFVAEKSAALSVVHDRLGRAGLGALCLSMHSKKANKREVLKALDEALRFAAPARGDTEASARLASCRDQLNAWSHALHQTIGETGRSPYGVIGRQLQLRADGVRLLPIKLQHVADWSKSDIDGAFVLEALDRASLAVTKLGCPPSDHPWFGTSLPSQSPFDIVRLNTTLTEALQKLDDLYARVSAIYAKVVGQGEPTLDDAHALVRAFRHLAAAPSGRKALVNPQWNQDPNAFRTAIDQGEAFSLLAKEVDAAFQKEAWAFDTAPLLTSLRADGPSFVRRLSRRFRKAKANYGVRGQPPGSLSERIQLVEKLRDAQIAREAFKTLTPTLAALLGPLWADTNWIGRCWQVAAWLAEARTNLASQQIVLLAARSPDVSMFVAYSDALDSGAQKFTGRSGNERSRSTQPAPFCSELFTSTPLTALRERVGMSAQVHRRRQRLGGGT